VNLKMLNTLSGQKEAFKPIKSGEVSIYVCGVTLYDDIHIGHLKSIISFEVMRNYFLSKGQQVTLVRNITDVDDKIIMKADQLGVDPLDLVNSYIDKFHAVLEQMQIPMPDVEPRVTQYLPEISDYIEDLIQNGTAYVTDDGVYFDTQKNKQERYPLSKKIVQDLDDNSRLDDKEYNKKHKADFALWKLDDKYGYHSNVFSKQGRPGWHIECSVMHHHTLGQHFDIHGGGRDLIFPHHENEILQSVAHNGVNPANYWLHNGMMTSNGKKLSKSLGNSIYVKDMLDSYSGEALKLFLNKGQYNQSQEFKVDELEDAQSHWDNFVRDIPDYVLDGFNDNTYIEQALNALEDDFNTPQVIIVLHEGLKSLRKSKSLNVAEDVLKVFKLLAVVPSDATLETVYEKWTTEAVKPSADIVELVNKRQQAKLDKDYTLADEYRKQVQAQGWQILDKGNSFELRKI
jgi:cysteinyl-tRNA synthetase